MNPNYYLVLSAILFSLGVLGFLIRRNALVAFMSIELMLNSANLAMTNFAHMLLFLGRFAEAHRDHLPYPTLGLGRRREPAEVLRWHR